MNLRLAFTVGVFALTSLTACTAIVLGKLGDTKDFPLDDGGVGNSSGQPTGDDDGSSLAACSLLPDFEHPGKALPENPCSQCIERSCAAEITYACNGGGEQEKDWFHTFQGCAQRPYDGFAPPEAGAANDSWGCSNYEDAGAAIIDNGSDAQHEQASKICVQQNCMLGDQPACHQCVVSTTKGSTDDISYLNADSCGKCFTDHCLNTIVACCNEPIVSKVLSKCSFTNDGTNKQTCQQFGYEGALDGGDFNSLAFNYEGSTNTCLSQLVACYNSFCKDTTFYSCEKP